MRRPFVRTVCIGLLLATAVAFAACGDDDDDRGGATADDVTPTSAPASPVGPQVQPEPPQPVDREAIQPSGGVIELVAENMLFVDNNLAVGVGESVTIRVTNNDSTVHNLRVAGTDGEYITQDDAVTTPDQIEPSGGVGELTFAPPVAGFYTFRCDFHPTSMGGQIVAGNPGTPPPTPRRTATPTPTPTPAASTSSAEGEVSETDGAETASS